MDYLDDLINSYKPANVIERWNNSLVTRDLSIYTPLSQKQLFDFFKTYRSDLANVEMDEDNNFYLSHFSYANLRECDDDYDLWGGMINSIEFGEFDKYFGFESKSEIYTDLPFESIISANSLDVSDNYFLEWKRLRNGLNEEGIPHYISMFLTCPDGDINNFLIGGINFEGKPIFPKNNLFLIESNFFSKEEWFFQSKNKFLKK